MIHRALNALRGVPVVIVSIYNQSYYTIIHTKEFVQTKQPVKRQRHFVTGALGCGINNL